tara:strand:- start:343 stop:597 length:255 start_codon:yes stop_codon:yes gene_type:complete
MAKNFELGASDHLFARIMQDETGRLKNLIDEIVMRCHEAAKLGVEIDELASVCTMGWYMAKDPEIRAIFRFMMDQTSPNPETIN